MNNYTPLSAAIEQVRRKNIGPDGRSIRADFSTTLGDFVGGFNSLYKVNSPSGELSLTSHGFKQLVRDRVAGQVAFFDDNRYPASLKLEVLRYAVQPYADEQIKVRVAGNRIEAVVSNDYSFFDNTDLMDGLEQLQQNDMLPPNLYLMNSSGWLSPDGRDLHLRLISPDNWDFRLGENGKSQNFHGNFILANNELAMGSFNARIAVTRTACLNSTVGQSLFSVHHKFANPSDFLNQLARAAGKIRQYASEMGEYLKRSQQVNVESPALIFQRIAKELNLPQYVLDNTVRYWEDEGSKNTLYDVTQSLSAGMREVTLPVGKRKPNWDARTQLESKLWSISRELQDIHAEGQSLEDWYMVGEVGLRARIVDLIRGYNQITPVADEIAMKVEELEI